MPISRRQTLGTCYYPEHWPEERWTTDAKLMCEAGLTHVRIGEFAWSRLEPTRGEYQFAWLDRAIEVLADAGLKIVLGTPTATPPKWLVDEMPDMLAVDTDGRQRGFGSRRHYCFSHLAYRAECKRIVTQIAERYGRHPALAAWQSDNEYGCHDTVLSYSTAARDSFRDWLAQKYQSPDALNRAWGNVFWSMEYTAFDQIELPNLTVTEPNPAHVLDFRRYSSEQVVAFNKLQCDVIRCYSDAPTSHNFMGSVIDFNHYDVGADLDIATWDSYPIGFLDRDTDDEEIKARYLGVGDPDLQAFHHDLYRACGAVRNGEDQGRWWVMEQQPGPVNWAPYNPSPSPGAVKLWAWEAFAHGAELVSYFRWRQPSFAQEQMHEAMLLPNGEPNEAFHAATEISSILHDLGAETTNARADVALVFDYETAWAWQTQPQGADFSALDAALRWYRALRKLGLNIDIVPPTAAAMEGRKLIVLPSLFSISDELSAALERSQASILIGPRTGSKTPDFQIHPDLPPGPLQRLIDLKITRVESRPPFAKLAVEDDLGLVDGWREFGRAGGAVSCRLKDVEGVPSWYQAGRVHYVTVRPDQQLSNHIAREISVEAGLIIYDLHRDVRIRRNGRLRYVFNYGPEAVDVSDLVCADKLVHGTSQLSPRGVAICELGD
ncbi:MAG: beta-galactosidase [Pseudomonadota bacterium]